MGPATGFGYRKRGDEIHRRRNRMSPLGVMVLGLELALWPAFPASQSDAGFVAKRQAMVAEQIAARGIGDVRVLQAMSEVPRHLFVPADLAGQAYEDHPLAIGN